jgi:hypothetical protein
MASYYRGRFADAVAHLEAWECDRSPRAHSAARVLGAVASDVGVAEPELAQRARAVAARLAPG